MQVRGTDDMELVYEVLQPDSNRAAFSTTLRRAIGLVRLGGDDRDDRDLRLVQGSALDRLLSARTLRSRLANELAQQRILDQLKPDAQSALRALDLTFQHAALRHGLDLQKHCYRPTNRTQPNAVGVWKPSPGPSGDHVLA